MNLWNNNLSFDALNLQFIFRWVERTIAMSVVERPVDRPSELFHPAVRQQLDPPDRFRSSMSGWMIIFEGLFKIHLLAGYTMIYQLITIISSFLFALMASWISYVYVRGWGRSERKRGETSNGCRDEPFTPLARSHLNLYRSMCTFLIGRESWPLVLIRYNTSYRRFGDYFRYTDIASVSFRFDR